jgi:CRP/FNR family cyclic AMP-dependent transcriptional regulator
VLISGGAKVLNSDEEGREVILTLLGPGEFFGEMGLIDGSPRSADVMATETCELLVITKTTSSAAWPRTLTFVSIS